MKLLHYSNVIFYSATLYMYIYYEITVGLLFQFFLGIIQLLFSLICRSKLNNDSVKKHMRNYAVLVMITFLIYIILLAGQPFSPVTTSKILIVVPMSIATYFLGITYLIQKS